VTAVTPALERDLVAECFKSAAAMGAFLAAVGQRRAKGSGTTVGYPDLTLICAGKIVLIECKRTKTEDAPRGVLNLGQHAFIARALEQGVDVRVVDTVEQFEALVNSCRRKAASMVARGQAAREIAAALEGET
jgi:hypothetical protein